MSFTSIETAQRMAAVEKKRKQGGDVIGSITLRDYFAAKALQGMLASETADDIASITTYALSSYLYADAMMKAREA